MKYELVKFVNNNLELEVNVSPNEDTVWLTKDQITLLLIEIERLFLVI